MFGGTTTVTAEKSQLTMVGVMPQCDGVKRERIAAAEAGAEIVTFWPFTASAGSTR